MSKAEGESDEVVNDYLDKKFDSTDEFLEKYVALRKVMHMRKAKLDKMGELMKNPDKNRTPARKAPEPPPPAANYQAPPGVCPNVPNWNTNSPNNLPYPINPSMMPMPPSYR